MKKQEAIIKRLEGPTGKELIEMSSEMADDPALTPQEKNHCEMMIREGFHYFTGLGWNREQEGRFLSRPNVKEEVNRQLGLLQDADGLAMRTKFFTTYRFMQMLPAAIDIVVRTLRGFKPGTTMKLSDMPTEAQYTAAQDVLRLCGISATGSVQITNITNNNAILPALDREQAALKASGGKKSKHSAEDVMRRTRVRTVLDQIIQKLGDTDNRIRELEKLRSETRTKKKQQREREHASTRRRSRDHAGE